MVDPRRAMVVLSTLRKLIHDSSPDLRRHDVPAAAEHAVHGRMGEHLEACRQVAIRAFLYGFRFRGADRRVDLRVHGGQPRL